VSRVACRQVPIRTYEGLSPFRAKVGEERPELTNFYSGPYLTERPIVARSDFEPGHINLGGSGCVLGRSGPKRTSPQSQLIKARDAIQLDKRFLSTSRRLSDHSRGVVHGGLARKVQLGSDSREERYGESRYSGRHVHHAT
jgi:hypothetical protein